MTRKRSMNALRAIFLPILFLALLCKAAAAEDGSGTSCSEVPSYWPPNEWTNSESWHDAKAFADRPGESTLNAIGVNWQEPKLDALGNFCTIRGQLTVPDERNAGNRPVDWLQGVTVYMAKNPEKQLDWSKGMKRADTVHSTAVVKRSGAFQMGIDLRETKQDRKRPQTFQFGIALAKNVESNGTRQKIVWNSKSPAIPATIAMLSVPAAPEVSHEIDLINHASGWPFRNPDGTGLIRAVNALQRLGKARALAELEKYIKLTNGFGYFSDQDIVFWIVKVLFPPEPGDLIRPPGIAVFLDDRNAADADKWPLNPIAVINDIPFMVGIQSSMDGKPEHPSSFIKSAKRYGIFREKPLVPSTNPLVAAEALFADEKFKVLDEYSRKHATRLIRSQALTMAGLTVQNGSRRPFWFYDELNDRNWIAFVAETTESKIYWDSKREQFVTRQ